MCRHHLFSAYPVPLSFLGWFYLKTEFGSVFALVAVESPAWKHLTKHLKSTSPTVIHMPGALPDISQVALKQNKQPFSRLKTCILLSVQEKVIKAKTLFLLDSVAWQSDVVIKFQLETSVLSAFLCQSCQKRLVDLHISLYLFLLLMLSGLYQLLLRSVKSLSTLSS